MFFFNFKCVILCCMVAYYVQVQYRGVIVHLNLGDEVLVSVPPDYGAYYVNGFGWSWIPSAC